jgi:RAT1-interacting protein
LAHVIVQYLKKQLQSLQQAIAQQSPAITSSMTDHSPRSNHTEADQKVGRRSSEDEPDSPPRKRPRTKAPPQQTAASNKDIVDAVPQPTTQSKPRPGPASTTQTLSTESAATHRFPVQPLNRFQGASASIKRPHEVAHFSYDDNHKYRDDESSINYYVPPPMGADLKEGFDTFKHYEDKEDPHLDSLLKALIHREGEDASVPNIKADFVTWRGMMTKVS